MDLSRFPSIPCPGHCCNHNFLIQHGFRVLNATLPETNSSPLKMDGWNTIVSFWGPAYFQG